jgi:two-component system, NtrC family, sensor kinase
MSDRDVCPDAPSERVSPVHRPAPHDRHDEDAAERARVEGELRLAQRLEAVGRLAAGIAHEISSPIQYVGDSLEFLRDALADLGPVLALARQAVLTPGQSDQAALAAAWEAADADFLVSELPRALDRSIDGVARVTEIVRAMRAFAHPVSDQRSPADLNDALTNTLVIARNEYKHVADIDCSFSPLPLVRCRLGELNEVFLNLIVNAAHAVADVVRGSDRRGRIGVRTRRDGAEVLIEIEDSGAGVPPELREKIFEPFFTTKAVGKGAGQGLAIARSIIKNHGGVLTLRSESGRGSTLSVRLPFEEAFTPCSP